MIPAEARMVAEGLRQGKIMHFDNHWECESVTFGYNAETRQFYMTRLDTLMGSYHKTDFYDGEAAFVDLLTGFERHELF
jgi:hypothetical protein